MQETELIWSFGHVPNLLLPIETLVYGNQENYRETLYYSPYLVSSASRNTHSSASQMQCVIVGHQYIFCAIVNFGLSCDIITIWAIKCLILKYDSSHIIIHTVEQST